MRKLYIDFDNTLFNTIKFNENCKKIIDKYINKEEQDKIFKSFTKIYDFREVLNILAINYNIDKELLIKDYNEVLKDNYLYDDVIEFLEYYKEKYELILLTWGNNEYQLDKINCSKISKYFKELLITQKLKYELDIDYKNSIFIDDNPRDLRGLMNNDSFKIIRLSRGKYMNYDKELVLSNVNSLKEIIEKGLI